jgi:hypothetical protein
LIDEADTCRKYVEPKLDAAGPWPTDLSVFEREIRPRLVAVPAPVLAAATGLSLGYCRRVKAGLASPHHMWWEALRALSDKRLVSD